MVPKRLPAILSTPQKVILSLWENIPEKQSASFWDNTSNTTSPSTTPQIQPHNMDVWDCEPSKKRLLSTQWPHCPRASLSHGDKPQSSQKHTCCIWHPSTKKGRLERKTPARGHLRIPANSRGESGAHYVSPL